VQFCQDVNQTLVKFLRVGSYSLRAAQQAFAGVVRAIWLIFEQAARTVCLTIVVYSDKQTLSSMMNERKSTGLPDKIYGDILNRILEGEYKEGERLPTEHALAERFETSRPTVREALARLRADGIIVTRHGSGTTVARRPDSRRSRHSPISAAATNSASSPKPGRPSLLRRRPRRKTSPRSSTRGTNWSASSKPRGSARRTTSRFTSRSRGRRRTRFSLP
jgi:DNA-binding transcriptional regulator YhcF (GntR family)